MPLFFFDVISPVCVRDPEGLELHDFEEAQVVGAASAEALLCEAPCEFLEDLEWVVAITDENRTVHLGIAISHRGTSMVRTDAKLEHCTSGMKAL